MLSKKLKRIFEKKYKLNRENEFVSIFESWLHKSIIKKCVALRKNFKENGLKVKNKTPMITHTLRPARCRNSGTELFMFPCKTYTYNPVRSLSVEKIFF